MPPIGKYSVPLQNYIGFLVFVHFDVGNHPGASRHPSKEGNLGCAALIPLLGGVPEGRGGFLLQPVFTAKQQDRKKDHILDNVVHCFHTHWQI